MADRYLCRVCSKVVTATANKRYRTHDDDSTKKRCENASVEIPEDLLQAGPETEKKDDGVPKEGRDFATCPECRRNVKLTRLGYFEPHSTTLYGGDRCPKGGTRDYYPAKVTGGRRLKGVEDVALPGDELPERGVYMAQSPEVSDTTIGKRLAADSGRVIVRPPQSRTDLGPATGTRTPVLALEMSATASAAPTAPTSGAPEAAVETITPDTPTAEGSTPAPTSPPRGSGSPDGSKESTTTSKPSAEPETEPERTGPFSLGTSYSEIFLQPFSPFSQPGEIPPKITLAESMSDRGKEIAARLRETFYAYTNRNSSNNRSAQKTLGPSEAGSPCDRQIAMKLLGIKPVNPQEGWAPFVGTAVHVELAKMFDWANGGGHGSGRYVTEMPLTFGSAFVPRGTSDLLDRVLMMILDHKLMGSWSLNKLIREGPSETYRIQGQIYALGAVLAGEKVREVAIVAWPRQESSLDKLYVHVEKFDRKIAEAALQRVERIALQVQSHNTDAGLDDQKHGLRVAREFSAGDDCKWCPFHLNNDKGFTRGCPGK